MTSPPCYLASSHSSLPPSARILNSSFPKNRLVLGVLEAGVAFPVFIQQHALDRIFGPHGRFGNIGSYAWMFREGLWESLKRPTIRLSGQDDETFLVDFCLGKNKVGYFVGRLVANEVLIQTFLFLTMDGTPEGENLRQRLHLLRADKSYLGLDDIGTYGATDLKSDPELVHLLSECGCAHLFKLTPISGHLTTGYAAAVRKHLRLDEAFPPRKRISIPDLQPSGVPGEEMR